MDTPQKIFFLTQQNSPYSMASGGLFAFQGGGEDFSLVLRRQSNLRP